MLNITRNENNVDIIDVESYFNILASDINLFDNDYCIKAIKEIDKVIYKGGGIVETPLGLTNIINLSTGCKVVLLLLIYNKKNEKHVSFVD